MGLGGYPAVSLAKARSEVDINAAGNWLPAAILSRLENCKPSGKGSRPHSRQRPPSSFATSDTAGQTANMLTSGSPRLKP